MTPFRSLYSRLLGRGQPAARLEEELALHVEFLAADYLRRGASPSEARAAALRELGNRTAIKEQYHERSGFPLLERVVQDFNYSLHSLRRERAFSIPSLAVIAVGFGAMIAVLSVVSALLWSPLPYPESSRLVAVSERDPAGGSWPFSGPSLLDLQQQTHALETVAGIRRTAVTLTGQGTPENLKIASVSPSFFPLFGVRPIAGQVFSGSAKNSLVITKALWIRKWHRLPSLIGQSVKLDGTSYVIAGIVDRPAEMLPGIDALTPLDPLATASRSQHEIDVFGRLAQGWKDTQLTAELQSIGARIARENAKKNKGWSITATPLFDYLIGPRTRKMLWLILAGVVLVWLLACANVASLQLARRLSRAREFATRAALGASRGRLLAQAFVENAVLALVGALLGLLLATWAIHLLRGVAGNAFPRLAGLHPDLKSLAAAFVALLLSTLFWPAARPECDPSVPARYEQPRRWP